MGVKEIFDRFRSRQQLVKQVQDQDYAVNKVEQRKLSAEERSLNKIQEKQRQELIKQKLNSIYKKQEKDYWKKDVITQPNIFREKSTLLHQKNIFAGGAK